MEVIHMVPFTVRERDQQIWLKEADTPPLDRGEMLIYYLNIDMAQLKNGARQFVVSAFVCRSIGKTWGTMEIASMRHIACKRKSCPF